MVLAVAKKIEKVGAIIIPQNFSLRAKIAQQIAIAAICSLSLSILSLYNSGRPRVQTDCSMVVAAQLKSAGSEEGIFLFFCIFFFFCSWRFLRNQWCIVKLMLMKFRFVLWWFHLAGRSCFSFFILWRFMGFMCINIKITIRF